MNGGVFIVLVNGILVILKPSDPVVLVFPEFPIFLYSFYCIMHDITQCHLMGHLTTHILHMEQFGEERNLLEAFRSNPVPAGPSPRKLDHFLNLLFLKTHNMSSDLTFSI